MLSNDLNWRCKEVDTKNLVLSMYSPGVYFLCNRRRFFVKCM